VPLRFVAENLGAEVIWDDKSQHGKHRKTLFS